jgi:hypothetical protein
MKAKILLYDIETSPNLGYTWEKYEQNVITFTKEWEILTFAYKWAGQKAVKVVTRKDFKDKTDKSITKALHSVLSQANVVVAHNGNSFDNKKSRAKFIEHGLGPTPPFAQIDTKLVARRHFKFNSNSLDDLGKLLKVGRKVKHSGFELWERCMAGSPSAFKEMAKYNKQDVLLLERVYNKLLPWIAGGPNMGTLLHRPEACPKCGGTLQSRGVFHTTTAVFPRYRCNDCGGWSRGPKSLTVVNRIKGV